MFRPGSLGCKGVAGEQQLGMDFAVTRPEIMDMSATKVSATTESLIVFQTSQGLEVRAIALRLAKHQVVFEVYAPGVILRMSEVLTDFKIVINDQLVYSGRAVVSSLVNTGTLVVCEASLGDSWLGADVLPAIDRGPKLREGFHEFLGQWQKAYKVLPDFKLLIGDIQMFLTGLRLWLDQVELAVRSTPSGDRLLLEKDVIHELTQPIVRCINALFEKFEIVAAGIPEEFEPVHHIYLKRQLHPLVLCSPFAYRTYNKPLGYAGDYEMVDMILRDPQEGSSLFAKLLNVWFLLQPPAEAHRNRIDYLTRKLAEETLRASSANGLARIFSLGCGPAGEVQVFLTQHPVCGRAQITLLDFNDETLAYTKSTVDGLKAKHGRTTEIQIIKKSVANLLKNAGKQIENSPKYDFLYCAGLFDYLTDRVCKQLMNVLYEMLAPGGLLLATNVDQSNPIRHMLDYVLEWHLLYRNGQQLRALAPDQADPDSISLRSDPTGVNIFLELRKPTP